MAVWNTDRARANPSIFTECPRHLAVSSCAPTGGSSIKIRATDCGWRSAQAGNIGERLMAVGERHYGEIRQSASDWLERVEFDLGRIDHMPTTFSGGMQQRLQIARNLVNKPRLIFMDEPTGGLDVSVQARLLDLLRALVSELSLSVIIVTHDLPWHGCWRIGCW